MATPVQNLPAGGRGRQPARSPWSVDLIPTRLSADRIEVECFVSLNGARTDGIPVLFSKEGNAEVGTPPTTQNGGKASWVFTLPPGAAVVRLKAEAVGQNASKEITVTIPAAPATAPATAAAANIAMPFLVIEETKLGNGRSRLAMALLDSNGKIIAGKLVLSVSGKIYIKDPFTRIPSRRETGVFTIRMPADHWTIRQIHVPGEQVEIDILIEGFGRKFELRFFGPEPATTPAAPGDGFISHLTDGWN